MFPDQQLAPPSWLNLNPYSCDTNELSDAIAMLNKCFIDN
jgi:hypothetical protein